VGLSHTPVGVSESQRYGYLTTLAQFSGSTSSGRPDSLKSVDSLRRLDQRRAKLEI
jgi:hypothetical protein